VPLPFRAFPVNYLLVVVTFDAVQHAASLRKENKNGLLLETFAVSSSVTRISLAPTGFSATDEYLNALRITRTLAVNAVSATCEKDF
jgi:hypothetical protein